MCVCVCARAFGFMALFVCVYCRVYMYMRAKSPQRACVRAFVCVSFRACVSDRQQKEESIRMCVYVWCVCV